MSDLINERIKMHDGKLEKESCLLVGCTGGTASGKTSLCHMIGEGLKERTCILSLDSFYKGLT